MIELTDEQNAKLIWYARAINPAFDDMTDEEHQKIANELYDEIWQLRLKEFIDRIDFMSDKVIVIADANKEVGE